jgi:histone H3/H4
LRKLCDEAITHAGTAGRKTVMDRDFEAILRERRSDS